MIQKLHEKRIKIYPLKGDEFLNDFVYNKEYPLIHESVLEDAFKVAMSAISFGYIQGSKAYLKRGITDGTYGVYMNEQGRRILNFLFNVEVKPKLNRNTVKYDHLIIQNLLYAIQDKNIKCLIFLGEEGIEWLYMDENYDLISQYELIMTNILEEYSPSKACSKIYLPIEKLKIYKENLPNPAHISNIIEQIIKHCGEL